MPVGVCIAHIPVQLVRLERMLSGKLCIIGGTTTIIIFCRLFIVRLCTDAVTLGIAIVAQLVKDVLQLIFVFPIFRHERKIEHTPQAHIVVKLVVNRLAQIVFTVVLGVINTKQVVLHVPIGSVFVTVIQHHDHPQPVPIHVPLVIPIGRKFQISQRFLRLLVPVIVQSVIQ